MPYSAALTKLKTRLRSLLPDAALAVIGALRGGAPQQSCCANVVKLPELLRTPPPATVVTREAEEDWGRR